MQQPLLSLLSFSILSTLSAASHAQSARVQADKTEVIHVYAQKRQQDIHDVSVAVTVVDGEDIARQHIKDTVQLSALAPNFKASSVAGEGTTPSFNIRGVGMFDYNTSTVSPIAIYSDEVVSGGANFLATNLYDLERVEILRGPQGTLFGRNTTGGAILLMSKMPDSQFGGYISGSVAERDHQSAEGALNLPVSTDTALRFSFNHQDYQYSMDNLFPGGQDGGLRQSSMRLIVKSEWQDVTLIAKLHGDDWSGAPKPVYSAGILKDPATGERCAPSEVGTPACVDAFGFSVDSDDYWDTVADTGDKRHDTQSWGGSLNLAWHPADNLTLKSITAYKDFERFHSFDSDGPGNFIEGSLGSENDFFSQEFSLSLRTGRQYWIAGLFYLQEELWQDSDLDLFRDFRAVDALASVPAQFFYHNRLKSESLAFYSQVDHELTQSLTLTAGVRYTDDSTRYHAVSDLDVVGAFIPGLWDIEGEVADDEVSGKLALVQALDANASVYYSYSRGYKSGGYNGGFSTSEEQARNSEYSPERLDAFEVGGHFYFTQMDLNLELAAFYYNYRDQQVFVNYTTGAAPYHVLKNAGDSTIYGLEAAFSYTPTSALQLDLNLGYIPKAKLGEYREGALYVANTQLPFTSELNISGLLQYELSLGEGRLLSQLGFDYQSSFYFDQNENPYLEQEGYSLWHGRIAWLPDQNWELGLWARNLFNEEYAELMFDSIAPLSAVTQLRGEARQVGVDFTFRF
ncbi:TonB-dependent receptor [Bowmanella dokdonensis]|uniref:TonB-dependent receptor n=1 Tax=Bowmanella dokdonensis TaxID=751969 RepID=A0A939IRD0_9ALTE|nr:TonB-dependent receptor [Bowmanella dokdonensis]MBN7825376.1 TonB-dependent receptor [Bowmanella dokdonensis]